MSVHIFFTDLLHWLCAMLWHLEEQLHHHTARKHFYMVKTINHKINTQYSQKTL